MSKINTGFFLEKKVKQDVFDIGKQIKNTKQSSRKYLYVFPLEIKQTNDVYESLIYYSKLNQSEFD